MDDPPDPPLSIGELCCLATDAALARGISSLTPAKLESLRTGSNNKRIRIMLELLPPGLSPE